MVLSFPNNVILGHRCSKFYTQFKYTETDCPITWVVPAYSGEFRQVSDIKSEPILTFFKNLFDFELTLVFTQYRYIKVSYRGCYMAKFRNFWPGAVNFWTVISDSWRLKVTVDPLKVKIKMSFSWNLNICCPSNKSESNNFTLIWWIQIKKWFCMRSNKFYIPTGNGLSD